MSFTPGKIVAEFTTKSGKSAVIRYPMWEDVPRLMEHINAVSSEDTYITFSGEHISLAEEANYVASEFSAMELDNAVKLFCFVEGVFAGVCDIHRNLAKKKRGAHVGIAGLVIGKQFRGDGVGYKLFSSTLEEARKLSGLRMVQLDCFATNESALSLYKKLGFQEVGRIPNALLHKGEYVDEVVMKLDL